MNFEKVILDIVAKSKSGEQTGDLSKYLDNVISPEQKKTLQKRDKFLSGGNPLTILDAFMEQNPN